MEENSNMSIQTVTTILTDQEQVAAQIDAAAGVARALDAHLNVLALAISIDQLGMVQTALDAVPAGMTLEDSIERARTLGDLAASHLKKEGIRWSVDPLGVTAATSSSAIVRHTRFSDLVVQPRLAGPAFQERTRTLAEAVLFDAGAPLLLLPEGDLLSAPPTKIMVSWDESAASLRAARQAMPLLSMATSVHVVLVDPPKDAPDRSDPGGAFAQYLARHGIKCELSVCNRTDATIAGTLERRAEELGCELIVMGAYGHSRLRQAIFGGTTRSMISDAKIPVFMAH